MVELTYDPRPTPDDFVSEVTNLLTVDELFRVTKGFQAALELRHRDLAINASAIRDRREKDL